MAEATKLKNAKVASTRYSQIVKKHGLSSGSTTSEPSTPSAAATKGNKRKATSTPGSGAKRAKKGASVSKKANDIDNEEGCVKVKTEDDHEAESVEERELEETDTALNS